MPFISMKFGAKEDNVNLARTNIVGLMNQFYADIDEEFEILGLRLLWVGAIELQRVAGDTKTFRNVFTFYEDYPTTMLTRIANCLTDVNTYISYMYNNDANYATPVKYIVDAVVTLEYK